MKQFQLGGRSLLLPDDAVLEWQISGEVFNSRPNDLSSSGLVACKEWNKRGIDVLYFKINLWVSHANLFTHIKHAFVIAFEDTESSGMFRGFEYDTATKFCEPRVSKVVDAIIACFFIRKMDYAEIIKTVTHHFTEDDVLGKLPVSCSDARSYMTSLD